LWRDTLVGVAVLDSGVQRVAQCLVTDGQVTKCHTMTIEAEIPRRGNPLTDLGNPLTNTTRPLQVVPDGAKYYRWWCLGVEGAKRGWPTTTLTPSNVTVVLGHSSDCRLKTTCKVHCTL